jgi:hypothetical protein
MQAKDNAPAISARVTHQLDDSKPVCFVRIDIPGGLPRFYLCRESMAQAGTEVREEVPLIYACEQAAETLAAEESDL